MTDAPETPGIRARGFRAQLADMRNPLVRNGMLLTVSSGLSAMVGLGYWTVAAWRYSAAAVGSNSAAISLTMLVAAIAQLNLSGAMVRFVPAAGARTRRLVAVAYLVSTGTAIVAGIVCVAAIWLIAPGVTFLEDVSAQTMFIAAVAAYALFVLQDGVLTALRRTPLVPVENVLFSITKLVLLITLAAALPVRGIFASWVLALGGAVVVVGMFLFARAIPRRQRESTAVDRLPPLRDIARFVAADYVGSVFSIASVTAMPVLVVAVLGPAQTAYYSIAWAIANAVHLINVNMGTSLVVETAADQSRLAAEARRVVARTATILIPAVAAVTVLAPYVLGLFGDGYRSGTTTLRLLVLAALPHLLVSTAISAARVRRKLRLLLTIQIAMCLSTLGLAAILIPRFGLRGAALAWLATQIALAAILLARRDLRFTTGTATRWWLRAVGATIRLATDTPLRPYLRPAAQRLRSPGQARTGARARRAVEGELPGDMHVLQVLPTVTDLRVALLSDDHDHPTAVLKIAHTPQAVHDLSAQSRTLARLADTPELGDWRTLLPRIVDLRAHGDTLVSVESFLPGVDMTTVLTTHPDRSTPLTMEALATINEFHRRTGTVAIVDDALLTKWVDRPLRQLTQACATMSPRSTGTVRRLGTVLHTALAGRRVHTGWAHGDFHAGNVRLRGADGGVTGVIDWGGARPGQLTALDGYLMVLTTRCLVENRELGAVVRQRLRAGGLPPAEREPMEIAWGTNRTGEIDEQAAILLTWLHHIVGLWTKSEAYLARPIWWALNVTPVLRAFATLAPAMERQVCAAPIPVDGSPSVDVVICAYTEDRWQDLVDAVASIHDQTRPVQRIVVVIDHCPALLHRATRALHDVTVVANRNAKGLSGARNTGIAEATADIVAFLDDDATAAPDWIAALVGPYSDPAVLGVGGRVEPAWRGTRPDWFPPEFDWVIGCSYRGLPTTRATVRNHIGANMSLRRGVLVESGGFAGELGRIAGHPLGCEETELCIRVSRAHPGGTHVYEPAAVVRHTVPPERTTWSYFRARCLAEGQSKAVVRRLAGAQAGLSSERAYLTSAIPRGIGHQLGRAARGHRAGVAGAGALVAGVALTALGYMSGTIHPPDTGTRQPISRYLVRHLAFAGLPVAMLLWALSLRHIDLDRIGDYGLLPLLPVTFWSALVVLLAGFTALVRNSRTPSALLAAHIGGLIAILHATPCIVYGTLRYSWAWKHVGLVDYFLHHQGTNAALQELSAYQYWPGFFTLNALLVRASGLHSALGYAIWAPPVVNALLIGPLVLIFRTATTDRRLIWSAVAIYVLSAWVGQDYFAPQAVAYFLYLSLIALCLHWFRRGVAVRPRQRVLLTALALVPMSLAIIVIHQLTPLMVVSGLVLLVLLCRYRVALLAVITLAFTVGWDLVAAGPWIRGNLGNIRSTIGSIWHNTHSGFINLGLASHSQAVVARIDRLHSAGVWALAGIGFARRFRYRRDFALVLLAVAPLPVLAGNDYGGEMIFRVYLFGLPFVAFFAAAALYPRPSSGRSLRTTAGALTVVLLLLTGFVFGYYGKEQANYFSPREVAAAEYLYDVAPPGSLIIGATSNFPWAFQHYEVYDYMWFALLEPKDRQAVLDHPVAMFSDYLDPKRHPHAFVILTRSETADVEMTGELPKGALERVTADLTGSPRFRVIYRNSDALVITANPSAYQGATR